jgi:hypothetical protein
MRSPCGKPGGRRQCHTAGPGRAAPNLQAQGPSCATPCPHHRRGEWVEGKVAEGRDVDAGDLTGLEHGEPQGDPHRVAVHEHHERVFRVGRKHQAGAAPRGPMAEAAPGRPTPPPRQLSAIPRRRSGRSSRRTQPRRGSATTGARRATRGGRNARSGLGAPDPVDLAPRQSKLAVGQG